MAGAVSALLRAGLAVKLGHLRQATTSYLRDRADEGRSTISGYVVGGAFYAVAGIFLIAALLIGAAALFRWVEMNYGLFQAFGATAVALVVLAALSAFIAASNMRPPKKKYPSLGSRLRVAMRAGPSKQTAQPQPVAAARSPASNRERIASARKTATAILRAPATPQHTGTSPSTSSLAKRAGLAVGVGLLGWAFAQRHARSASPSRQARG